MISLSKPRYACKLVTWHIPYPNNPGIIQAAIIRLDTHHRLGPPADGKITVTSAVLRIDTEKRLFETLNSVYNYGG